MDHFSHAPGVPILSTMGRFVTFNFVSAIALIGALCVSSIGCEPAEPTPEEKQKKREAKKKRKKDREKQRLDNLERQKERNRGVVVDELELAKVEMPNLGGELVRVWRRRDVTGILEVKEERHASSDIAMARLRELTSDGWRHWSPSPAPELASGLAVTYPEFAECPFIMEISNTPTDWGTRPGKHLACYRTVDAVETALEREVVIAFHQDQVLPCAELKSLTIEEDGPYLRSLRNRCRAMGLEVDPREKGPPSRELVKRRKSNRLHKKRVSPRRK